jgi:predicted secreted hydrolase
MRTTVFLLSLGKKEKNGRVKGSYLILALQLIVLIFVSNQLFANDNWKQANVPIVWDFPKDLGSHHDFRTEWWYFTGNLIDEKGNKFGYQLTFFREGISRTSHDHTRPWALRDLYFAHFAITDVNNKRHFYEDRVSRTGPNLAGSSDKQLNVWLLDWSVFQKKEIFHIHAKNHEMEISLVLSATKPLSLHGKNGLVQKGSDIGQASYYCSYTRLNTKGILKTPLSLIQMQVSGTSWFDHEFGSNQLSSNLAGWDWFSLHLSDKRDLMIYLLRRKNGSIEPASSATIVDMAGKTTHIAHKQVRVIVLDYWTSKKSGARYPSRWRIVIPQQSIDITVLPMVADQELNTTGSTGIIYWEGAVEGIGNFNGKIINATGYAELTGYFGEIGGIF